MNYIKRILFLLFMLLAPAGIYFSYWSGNVIPATVIFTSDGHGHILPGRAYWEEGNPEIGGLGSLASFLSGLSKPYILTDSGDIFQGTPEGVLTGGRVVIDIMNELGYDAAAVGNHEFDFGTGLLEELARKAAFPLVSGNIKEVESGRIPEYLSPFTSIEINGIEIGITGVVTPHMDRMTLPENIAGLEFTDPSSSAAAYAAELRENGADVIILLSHQGYEDDVKTAVELGGSVDIILGGHSHKRLNQPHIAGRTIICQPGYHFQYAGQLDFYYSRLERRILSYNHRLHPLYTAEYAPDEAVGSIIKSHMGEISVRLDEVIGESGVHLPRNLRGDQRRHRELALGNLQADIMRETLGADFAFQNTGGIRADIPAGPVKVRDIWALAPFGNTLVKMTFSGSQVRELLEQSAAQEYSFLQVSGMNVVYNSSLPPGRRILNVIITGPEGSRHELADDEEYTVATNSFLAQGGDGYTVFTEGREAAETSILLRDTLIEHFRDNSPVYAETQERLVNVSIE